VAAVTTALAMAAAVVVRRRKGGSARRRRATLAKTNPRMTAFTAQHDTLPLEELRSVWSLHRQWDELLKVFYNILGPARCGNTKKRLSESNWRRTSSRGGTLRRSFCGLKNAAKSGNS
jgi:hypothetical protein